MTIAPTSGASRTRRSSSSAIRKALVALSISLGAIGLPAASAAASPAQEQVMAVTQAVCDAFRQGDLAALELLLASDFTLVGPDASIQPRSQAIAEVRAGEPRYDVFRNHDMTARVYGDAAVVQGITSLQGHSGGKPFAVDVRFTDTLVRSDGRWRIVVSHVTRIPAKP